MAANRLSDEPFVSGRVCQQMCLSVDDVFVHQRIQRALGAF